MGRRNKLFIKSYALKLWFLNWIETTWSIASAKKSSNTTNVSSVSLILATFHLWEKLKITLEDKPEKAAQTWQPKW